MIKFIQALIERLHNIGVDPICNGLEDRAPHILGWCFPLCYRCTFTIIGLTLSAVFLYRIKAVNKLKRSKKLLIIIILFLPIVVDGYLQYFFGIESDNIRRAFTGFFCGVGIAFLSDFIIHSFILTKK